MTQFINWKTCFFTTAFCFFMSSSPSPLMASETISEGVAFPKVKIQSSIENQDIVDWEGKVTILNFWATWCESCKVELVEMQQEFDGLFSRNDVLIRFVSLDKDPKKAIEYMTQKFGAGSNMLKALAFDSNFKVADTLGLDAFPFTIVLNKSGTVVKVHKGFKEGQGSTKAIAKEALNLLD